MSVKYRKPKLQATMARLDPEYAQLKIAAADPNATPDEKQAATAKLEASEKHLMPAYQSVAIDFADLREFVHSLIESLELTPPPTYRRQKWTNAGQGELCALRLGELETSYLLVSPQEGLRSCKYTLPLILRDLQLTTVPQRIMKKLSVANPNLTFPERQALMGQFVPSELSSDSEVAAFIEKAGDRIDEFVQTIRDDFCAETVVSWA